MFTLEIDSELEIYGKNYIRVTLNYKSETTTFKFYPHPYIKIVDSSCGSLIQGHPIAGTKYDPITGNTIKLELSWTDNIIKLYSMFDNSDIGGSIEQTVTLNDKELQSFHYCLRKWQAYQQHINNGGKTVDFEFK